jgi:hypothetical protein
LGYPDELATRWRERGPQKSVPLPGSGIGTGFPFAQQGGRETPHIGIGFLLGLRID